MKTKTKTKASTVSTKTQRLAIGDESKSLKAGATIMDGGGDVHEFTEGDGSVWDKGAERWFTP